MAEEALDMTLDDLIKKNKTRTGGKPRGGAAVASGAGPSRRFPNRSVNRAAPYSTAKAPETAWNHDMFAADQGGSFGQGGGRASSSIETGIKLYISNLDYGVSNEDIKELFSEVGDLKRYAIHYDRSGRSKGTAEVVFSRRQDALAGVRRFNNVQLDGKPMKIEIVGTNIATPTPPFPNGGFGFGFGDANGFRRSGQARGGSFGRSRGGRGRGRGFRGGNRGRGREGRGEKISAEDLDADLMKYHTEAMQTN